MRTFLVSTLLIFTMGVNSYAQDNFSIDNENSTLTIAGYQFSFGDKATNSKTTVEKVRRHYSPRVSSNVLGKMRWGYNYLSNNDLVELNKPLCAHFSMDLYTIKTYLDSYRNVSLATGIQFVYNDIVFADDVSISYKDNVATIYPLDHKTKKSKLAGRYIGIPLYLNFYCSRAELSLMAFANYNIKSFTKLRGTQDCFEEFRGLNEFQYGFGASISFEDFGVYALYSTSPFWRPGIKLIGSSNAANMNTISVGIMINLD